jgi:hypothetical protein
MRINQVEGLLDHTRIDTREIKKERRMCVRGGKRKVVDRGLGVEKAVERDSSSLSLSLSLSHTHTHSLSLSLSLSLCVCVCVCARSAQTGPEKRAVKIDMGRWIVSGGCRG